MTATQHVAAGDRTSDLLIEGKIYIIYDKINLPNPYEHSDIDDKLSLLYGTAPSSYGTIPDPSEYPDVDDVFVVIIVMGCHT